MSSSWKACAATCLAALATQVVSIMVAGHRPPGLDTVTKTLALDPASQAKITAQAAAADIALIKASTVLTTYRVLY
ncbi:MAG TPA: hypothetical protein VMF53_17380 [Alphaproteobacteria bacterium]|nr:hypothetical protein [Alphaproteobacteria bacterium]